MVFRWFRKGPAIQAAEPRLPDNEQRAYEQGQEIGRKLTEGVFAYVKVRSDGLRERFLDLLQMQIDEARYQEKNSPILMARVEYNIFRGHVNEAMCGLTSETVSAFKAEWGDSLETLGVDDDLLTKMAQKAVDDHLFPLTLEGLKIMTDNADILKRADDSWRRKFPDLASEQALG